MSAALATAPRAALLLKVDTLGDLVLFAPTLRALTEAWPDTRISVVIRRPYLDLAPLLAPHIEWVPTTLDPFAHGPDADPGELDRLRAIVAQIAPDLVAAATSRRNWLDAVLAASAPQARRLALGNEANDEFFSTQLRLLLGFDAATVFPETVPASGTEPDYHRNLRLADRLLGRVVPRTPPTLAPGTRARDAAAEFLRENQLEPAKFVVCAPAGFANVKIKTWPADRFATALNDLRESHRLPPLLVGHESERTYLESIASQAGGAALWLGTDGSLELLSALLADSALYFGNDTGAMHLAAAVGVPVVAIFGGGTWPRFIPAAQRGVALVHPLPCFGCGWDCAFGDAPCVGWISVADATGAIASALVASSFEVRTLDHVPPATRLLMATTSTRYRASQAEHLARQHKLEELTSFDREKDVAILEKESAIAEKEAALIEQEESIREKEASIHEKERSIHEKEQSIHEKDAAIREKEAAINEKEAAIQEKEAAILEKEASISEKEQEINSLKAICNEREKTIFTLDAQVRSLLIQLETARANHAQLEKSVTALSTDGGYAIKQNANLSIHIRNTEALLQARDRELAEVKATRENLALGLEHLEQAKRYGRLLAEKEAVIQSLNEACIQRETVIRQLAAETTTTTAKLHKVWIAITAHLREKFWRPFDTWLFKSVVEDYWMQIGVLRHYEPRALVWDRGLPGPRTADATLPQIAVVTPSYGQEKFIERTMRSVLDQNYPRLLYAVQDGASRDRSAEVIGRYASRLRHWESVKDAGQADAIRRGFNHLQTALGPNDLMAWINSDDLLAPGSLRAVAEYFAAHPEIDVVYGHRIIIDDDDRDVGRWVMPRHDPHVLEWIDYVPQETMFWRKRAWDLAGGIDPSFQFALDWDLLARFQQAGCRFARLPWFLGAFRVHAAQKTSQDIHTTGAEEMARIRSRFHGPRQGDFATINRFARRTRFRGAIVSRLLALGVRW